MLSDAYLAISPAPLCDPADSGKDALAIFFSLFLLMLSLGCCSLIYLFQRLPAVVWPTHSYQIGICCLDLCHGLLETVVRVTARVGQGDWIEGLPVWAPTGCEAEHARPGEHLQ